MHRGRHPGAELRQPEVQDLGVAPAGDEDVGRLDVPVHDAPGMRRIERIGNLRRDLEQLLGPDRRPLDPVLQRLPFEQLHGDEALPRVLADLVNGADVRVIQRGGRTRFAREPLERELVL
jgi:hypothetical protein